MPLTLTRPRAVVFDMDGLLLDSERVTLDLFAQAASDLGIAWNDDIGLAMVGVSSENSDRLIAATFGSSYPVQALRERFDTLYEQAIHAGHIPLKPFVRELIDHLDSLGIPCAVATSTRRYHAEAKLARASLLPRMRALACGDEVLHAKPAPEIYELAASRLGVEPRDCLALEDSNIGVRAAVSANMQTVMVPDLLKPDADIRRLGVPCVDSLKVVLAALQN